MNTKLKQKILLIALFIILLAILGFFAFSIYKYANVPRIILQKQEIANNVDQTKDVVEINKEGPYKILKVVDGDTIDIDLNGLKERVRLIGINTPEVVDPRKPVECFGKEASEKAKSVLSGKSVFIENDGSQQNRDKYDRLLRYIYLEDGTNFNKMMIEEGFAYEYTYDLPYKYQKEFKKAQIMAEGSKKGLWADGVCLH